MIFEIIVYTTSSIKQNKVDIFICGHILLNCPNDSLHPYFPGPFISSSLDLPPFHQTPENSPQKNYASDFVSVRSFHNSRQLLARFIFSPWKVPISCKTNHSSSGSMDRLTGRPGNPRLDWSLESLLKYCYGLNG